MARGRRSSTALLLAAAALCSCWLLGSPWALGGPLGSNLAMTGPTIEVELSIAADVEPEVDLVNVSRFSHFLGDLGLHPVKLGLLACWLCLQVAKREAPPPLKQDATPTPLDKRGDYGRVLGMSMLLSLVSGIVNAMAFLEMKCTVAHHTGNMSHTGRLWGTDGSRFLFVVIAYFVGSAVAGYGMVDGEAVFVGRYSAGIMSSALAIASGVVIYRLNGDVLVPLCMLSVSQGIMNAVTRKCSSLPVCTTHMTGYLTDIGSGLGAWLSDRCSCPLPVRIKFFLGSILAFIAGGFVAKKLLEAYGIMSAFVPAALMALAALGLVPLPAPAGGTKG